MKVFINKNDWIWQGLTDKLIVESDRKIPNEGEENYGVKKRFTRNF